MKESLSFLATRHLPSLLPLGTHKHNSRLSSPQIKAVNEEIRVCVNRTCRKQGSIQTLEILSGIAPPDITVKSCGCLGRCGSGPNLVVLPDGVFVDHCGTAAKSAQIMITLCGGSASNDDVSRNLDALALRKRAELEFDKGSSHDALLSLSKAIHLKPSGGIHLMFKVRSSVKLAMGDYSGALEDAEEALALAPLYPEAFICQGDAFLAMNQFDAAERSYSTALDINPSLRRSKSFKARISKLQEKLIAARL